MQLDTFLARAKSMGDFYCYFNKEGEKWPRMGVCTLDLTTKYIADRVRPFTLKEGEVMLWNFNTNRPMRINVADIVRVKPLSDVLKNG